MAALFSLFVITDFDLDVRFWTLCCMHTGYFRLNLKKNIAFRIWYLSKKLFAKSTLIEALKYILYLSDY